MDINKLKNTIDGRILNKKGNEKILKYAFSSDLMSDVLCIDKDGLVLITGLSTMQTIRTAEMSNADCVVIARGKCVSQNMIELAEENNIVLITTNESVFNVSGKLYTKGLKPVY